MCIAGITQMRSIRFRINRPASPSCLLQWRANAKVAALQRPFVIDDQEGLASLYAIRRTLALQRKMLTRAAQAGGKSVLGTSKQGSASPPRPNGASSRTG